MANSIFMKSIADLNENAICHLRAGNCDEAISELQKALLIFRQKMHHSANECAGLEAVGNENDGNPFNLVTVECLPIEAETSERNLFKLYRRLFSISKSDGSTRSPANNNILLATILYNLASAHHLHDVTSRSAAHDGKALQLYELAYATMEKAANEYYPSDQAFFMILCALYNNMGYVHDYYLNSSKALSCLEGLQLALRESSASLLLNRVDYSFFSQYLVINAEKLLALAPAA